MERKIYFLPDVPIAFFNCEIEGANTHGDCTNYYTRDDGTTPKFYCNQDNIHFCCAKHKNYEIYEKNIGEDDYFSNNKVLWCDKCAQANTDYAGINKDIKELVKRAQILINSENFKNAKLIRIDDQCFEIKLQRLRRSKSGYISAWGNIETDITGNPQVNLYIGCKNNKKVHYFIEPELNQIRYELSDTDIDPNEIIAKITLETAMGKTTQEYKKEAQDE